MNRRTRGRDERAVQDDEGGNIRDKQGGGTGKIGVGKAIARDARGKRTGEGRIK